MDHWGVEGQRKCPLNCSARMSLVQVFIVSGGAGGVDGDRRVGGPAERHEAACFREYCSGNHNAVVAGLVLASLSSNELPRVPRRHLPIWQLDQPSLRSRLDCSLPISTRKVSAVVCNLATSVCKRLTVGCNLLMSTCSFPQWSATWLRRSAKDSQ